MNGKRNKHIGFGLIFLMALMLAFPAAGWSAAPSAGTLDIRVADVADDAEENAGAVQINELDLDLGQKDAVGIRFQNVTIPPGSAITRAYIQFTADVVSSGIANLTIYTEKSANADAFNPAFVNDITARNISGASVAWDNVPAWGSASGTDIHQSPDLSEIVEAVVAQGGWGEGNSIVFVIKGQADDPGHRIGTGYLSGAAQAPLLHVEYAVAAIDVPLGDSNDDAQEAAGGSTDNSTLYLDLDANHLVGLRFPDVNVPPGAQITNAYISLAAHAAQTDATSLSIYVEADDDAISFSNGNHNISNRSLADEYIRWTGVTPWLTAGNFYRTPDLSRLVQQIVGRAGWASNNAMVFVLEASHGLRQAIAYNADPAKSAVLHIEYAQDNKPIISTDKPALGASCYEGNDAAGDTFTITNRGVGTLDYVLSDTELWITLSPTSGTLAPGQSQTITVTYDTDALGIGTYSGQITITDAAAANSPADVSVSLTVLKALSALTCSNVPVYAQDLVSPAVMIMQDDTGSMKQLVPIDANYEFKQPPDLSAIVQEIVNRPGWAPLNDMMFLMEPTGSWQRAAWSWTKTDGANGPKLHVTYNTGGASTTITARTTGDGEEGWEAISTGTVMRKATPIFLGQNGSGDAIITGLRFVGADIPQGATIESAVMDLIVEEVDTVPANPTLTIWGEDIDDSPAITNAAFNLSNRLANKTSASVVWTLDPWDAVTWTRKWMAARDVIKTIIQDKGISWGFGRWTSWLPDVPDNYTWIIESCEPWSAAHIASIEAAADGLEHRNSTPYKDSIIASRLYFEGAKAEYRDADNDGNDDGTGEVYVPKECQPRFLVHITDGLGNVDAAAVTEAEYIANVGAATRDLAQSGVTPVAIGFDLPIDQAGQIYEFARVANQEGNADPNDDVYALHEVDGGIAQPFFVNSQEDYMHALRAITDGVKGAIYHGAAPAPTTSTDLGDTVVVAKYDATTWTGDVERIQKDAGGQWVSRVWSASAQMPSPRNLFTIDPATDSTVVEYTAATLTGDNFDCLDPGNINGVAAEPIGDIINSRPAVVDQPPYWYKFDDYGSWGLTVSRDPMIYVGANDGALHAFNLFTGEERWAFFPKSLHAKLEAADGDPLFDRCSDGYCHQYYVDGSPVVGDVYAKFGEPTRDWHTILVVGQREGGEAYTALDVTYGKEFDDADLDKRTKFLWEFSDAELGQTWGDPTIQRVAIDLYDQDNDPTIDTPSEWAVFFSSGYTDPMTDKEAYVYGIVADDASELWLDSAAAPTNRIKVADGAGIKVNYKNLGAGESFAVGETVTQTNGPAASGTILAVVTTSAQEGTLTLVGVTGTFEDDRDIECPICPPFGAEAVVDGAPVAGGGLSENALAPVLAADLLAPTRSPDPWLSYYADYLYVGDLYGNMYRITDIGKDMTPQVSKLFTFNHATPGKNPIRGRASYGYDYVLEDIWVYFGTGIFEQQMHKGNNDPQYFFGLKDGVVTGPTYDPNGLVSLEARFDSETIGSETHLFRYIEGSNPAADPWKMQLFAKQGGWGWTGDLPEGSERMFTQPLVVGEVVFFTTFIPDADVCGGSGETWLFALNFNTGTMASQAVFDINGDGVFDDQDKIDSDNDGVKDVFPVGIRIGRGVGSHPVLHKDTLFVTVSGEGDKFFAEKINLPKSRVRVRSWWQN